MKLKNNDLIDEKGGKREMEIQGIIFLEKCQYCNREFKSLYKTQVENFITVHELTCKENPSNKTENVKNI
jgi:hypothetical protein